MKSLQKVIATLFVCVTLAGLSGCGAVIVGGAAAAGTYAYVNGDASGTYFATIDDAFKASLATCKELGIPVVKQTKDGSSGEILGKYAGDSVTISLDLVGDSITEITVRVGLWGNEHASRRIHNNISQRL
ncbi:DUF3568 domain-containing protein [Pseudodesulfovibrio sp.]|nr:DUF3568 domain-containing protein [Pseudodesulfovibrio sp.]